MSYRPIYTGDWYRDRNLRRPVEFDPSTAFPPPPYQNETMPVELREILDRLNASFDRMDRILERRQRRLGRYFIL